MPSPQSKHVDPSGKPIHSGWETIFFHETAGEQSGDRGFFPQFSLMRSNDMRAGGRPRPIGISALDGLDDAAMFVMGRPGPGRAVKIGR